MEATPSARKAFFKTFRSKAARDDSEMSFTDHLEALRWHLMRAVIAWLMATVVVFVYVDFVFDEIVYAPARSNFITYRILCDFSHWAGLGESLCMPPVNIKLLGNTISGPFMSAISIAMIGGLIVAFPYLFWELWKFVKPALSTREVKKFTWQHFLGEPLLFYWRTVRVFPVGSVHF